MNFTDVHEAMMHRYGSWADTPRGHAYVTGRCAEEVYGSLCSHQCTRKNGHGPAGLYCKQHGKKYGK